MTTLAHDDLHARTLEWVKEFRQKIEEGERRDFNLFRLETFLSETNLFYLSFIHPAVGMLHLFVIALAAYMIRKLKIRTFIIDIIFVCSLLKCLPRLLFIPLHLVFTMYFKIAEPMLYPWCLIYYLLYDTVLKGTELISINLNILLAVNRYCSVYYPFKIKIWFSNNRNKIFCSAIIILTSLLILALNYRSFNMPKDLAIGDLLNNGKITIYPACSLQNVFIHVSRDAEYTATSHHRNLMIELSVVMVCTVCLGILDVILLKKLWNMRHQQFSSFDGAAVFVQRNSSRMLLLNKIACLVISGVVIIQIPHLILYVITIFQGLSIQMGKIESIIESNAFVDIFSIILYDIFAPLDIVLFLISSEKVKNHLKEKFCVAS